MRVIKLLLIFNTLALLLIMLVLTGILNRQPESAAYDTYQAPPVTWSI